MKGGKVCVERKVKCGRKGGLKVSEDKGVVLLKGRMETLICAT